MLTVIEHLWDSQQLKNSAEGSGVNGGGVTAGFTASVYTMARRTIVPHEMRLTGQLSALRFIELA